MVIAIRLTVKILFGHVAHSYKNYKELSGVPGGTMYYIIHEHDPLRGLSSVDTISTVYVCST